MLLILARAGQGASQGFIFPPLFTLVSTWIPKDERTATMTYIQAGTQIGTIVGLPLGGVLANSVGWESVFYATGAAGVAWAAAFFLVVYDSPEKHPRISEAELKYIRSRSEVTDSAQQLPFPPLLKMLTSLPLLANMATHFGSNWAFFTLLTMTPTYLSNVQHFPLESVRER